uniref:Uncharacterized protein n=1 Tax=Rhizophora mucronata TaxID=61149 RepID=A0A2P2NC65_RHIMU
MIFPNTFPLHSVTTPKAMERILDKDGKPNREYKS